MGSLVAPFSTGIWPCGTGLGQADWTPASLGSSLKGWWKADAGVFGRTAAQFTAANSESLSRADEAAIQCGDIDFYWCGWFYIDATSAVYRNWVYKGAGDINQTVNYAFYKDTADKPTFWVGDNSTTKSAVWGSALSATTWYFIEGYHDSVNNLVGICVNRGTDVTAATAGIVPFSGSAGALRLGGLVAAGHYIDGRMGNVVFFKRLPSAAERNLLYNSGNGLRYADAAAAGVSMTSLTGWWEMDEESGTRADKSGNALTLTDNNTVTANDGKVAYAVTADGSVVYQGTDQGTAALAIVQATHTKKPLLKTNVANGQPVLRGDGVDDFLKSATGAVANQPQWGWIVVDDNDAGTRYYSDGGAASKVSIFHDGTNLNVNAGSSVGGAHTAGAFHLVTTIVNGASSFIYVDGVQLATGDAGAQNQDSGLTLFADNAGASPLAGDIAERAVVSGLPSATDLANLRTYVVARYGITVS